MVEIHVHSSRGRDTLTGANKPRDRDTLTGANKPRGGDTLTGANAGNFVTRQMLRRETLIQ